MGEITKEHLEEKLNLLIAQYKQVNEELSKYSILIRKLEGAIEVTQALIKEFEETSNTSVKQENKEQDVDSNTSK